MFRKAAAFVVLVILAVGCGNQSPQATSTPSSGPGHTTAREHHAGAGKASGSSGKANTTKHATSGHPQPSPATSGPAAQPGHEGASPESVEPIQPGTYRYDTTGSSTYGGGFTQQMPSETTLTADPQSGAHQRSVRDLRDAQGNGSVTETWLEFRDGDVYLDRVRSTTTYGPVTDVRDFRPSRPELVGKAGAGPGFHTEFTMTSSGSSAHVSIDVVREERVTVGGRSVDTLLVRTDTTFSGDLSGESTSDTWYTLDRLLPVKERVVIDAQTSSGSFHSEYRAELKQLAPA